MRGKKMRRVLPFRLSSRPGRQFLNFLLLKELKKSSGKEIGVDVGCGEMINYELFRTKKYIGTEIDQSRLDAGIERYPLAQPVKASIFDKSVVFGDFVLCIQVFNNKHFDNTKTELAVRNLCDTVRQGGDLVFNIGKNSLKYEDHVDKILKQHFSDIKKTKYEPNFFVRYTGLFTSFIYGALMYMIPPMRTMGGYNKILYCAKNKFST
jgi:hypothetical protein